jgi:hypothetical protein
MFAMPSYQDSAVLKLCALQNSVGSSWIGFEVPFSVKKLQNSK